MSEYEYVTEDYLLAVGEALRDGIATPVYHILNRVTGVVEFEDYLLPRAVDTMLEMQVRLSAVNAKYADSKRTYPKLIEVITDAEETRQ